MARICECGSDTVAIHGGKIFCMLCNMKIRKLHVRRDLRSDYR